MKVAHVVRQFSPSVGGLESAVYSLAKAQRDTLGIDAQVVTLDSVFGQPGRLVAADIIGGVPVTRLPWRGSTRYPVAVGVLRHARDADIVHVHAIDFFFDFLALTRPLHRRTLIASTHGGFFHTQKYSGLKKIWFQTITRTSLLAYRQVVACSHGDFETFRALGKSRLAVIENGVDLEKFAGAASDMPARTIIYFGRFTAHKRVEMLLPMLAALRRLHSAWRLIIAGREDDLTVGQLMAMAERAGVADAVSCVTGPTDAQLRGLIGEASFFACLSSYEGFGLAAVEAMSAGLLPVLSGIAPFKRLCESTQAGLIVDPAAPAEAAAMVEANVLGDAGNALRKYLLREAVSRYDWNHVSREYARIYEDVAARAVRPAARGLESRV